MTQHPLPGPGLGERLSQRLLTVLPEPLATHPERVLINLAAALIGLSALVQNHGLSRIWPDWLVYEWASAMLVGGTATLVGIFRRKRTLDRLGMLLVLFSSLFYAATILLIVGVHGLFTALIFVGIAAAKTIRLIVTGAVRAGVIQRGREQQEQDTGGEDTPADGH